MRDKLPREKLPRLSRELEGMRVVDGSGLIPVICAVLNPVTGIAELAPMGGTCDDYSDF